MCSVTGSVVARPGIVLQAYRFALVMAAASELPLQPGLSQERAEELISQIRAGRDSRLWTPSTPTC
jgi:hypothetical protein